jgi:hypothetical protein
MDFSACCVNLKDQGFPKPRAMNSSIGFDSPDLSE